MLPIYQSALHFHDYIRSWGLQHFSRGLDGVCRLAAQWLKLLFLVEGWVMVRWLILKSALWEDSPLFVIKTTEKPDEAAPHRITANAELAITA